MNPTISKIAAKYPEVFTEEAKKESYCPEGWEYLLDSFCSALVQYNSRVEWEIKGGHFERYLYKMIQVIERIKQSFYHRPENLFLTNKQSWVYHSLYLVNKFLRKRIKWQEKKITPIKIEYIKSKFATLRIFCDRQDTYVDGMIWLAHEMSSTTCEHTGSRGSLYKRHKYAHYKTLCPEKAAELGFEKA